MPYTIENAKSAYNFTEQLAFPRLVGSEGEKKAKALLHRELSIIGIPFSTESFKASTFPINILFRIILPIGAFFFLLAWITNNPLFGLNLPIITIIFSLIGLIWMLSSGTIFNKGFGRVPSIGTAYDTENFISEIEPDNQRAHLILMAHYDSKSQFFPALIRVTIFIVGLIMGLLSGIRLLGGAIIISVGTVPTGFWAPNWITFWIMFLVNMLPLFNYISNKSPGAIDNATSVATLLEILKLTKSKLPKNIKVTFLFTGAEELGLYGAADYIKRHKAELDPKTTFFLNFDGIGSGKNLLLTSYGIPLKTTSQFLNDLIFQIVREQSIDENFGKVFLPIGAATDHVPIQAAGYEVSVIVSTMPRTHTAKDTIEYVKLDSLQCVGIIGLEIIQKLDQNYKT